MTSLTESSMGSVPIEELRAAALRLDQYKEPSHGAQVVSAHDPNGQQSIAQDSNASDEASNSKGATVPESIEQRIPNDSLPRARERLHAAPVNASPEKMPALREGDWVEIPKAASFMEGGGDTQPWASQAVLETSKSMIADGQTTPQRPHTVAGQTPNTYCSTVDGDIDLGLENMPSLTSQAGYGSYGRDTDMAESAAVAASPTTSQAENDLLREDTQPQTEARTSSRDVPATPALAGQKRARSGELLTSATTISKTPHYSQYFKDGEKPPTMTNTQLFRATDSSPLSAPPSDPILSRPSPHTNGFDRPSSPSVFSSPDLRRKPGRAASLAQPEPMTRYISMKESQEMRRQRVEAERLANLNGEEGEVEDEIDELEDSWDRRPRRGIPRPRPHSEHLSRVTAPARSSSRSRSAHDAIEIKDTPDTARKASDWNDFVVGFAVGPQQAIEDEDEDQEMAETQDLPEECNVQFSERDDPGVSDAEPEEHGNVEIEDVGNDEYDEFGQGLRSQADDIAQDDDDMAAEAPAEQEDVSMEDVNDPHAPEHAPVEKVQSSARTSQRSAIANSQPTAAHPNHPSASQQAVQYSSYVPGSQHQGRTSEDTALLRAPHASEQSRVAASQLQTEESTETSVSGTRIPSSPPVQVNANSIYDDHAEASEGKFDHLAHAEQAEVQESDVIEDEVSELQSANGPEDSVPLYSTARTHVSGSAPSPAKNKMVGLSQQLGQSQRSKSTDQSPSIRRFADFAASGSMPMNHSIGIDYSQPDVVALVDTLFTAEDRQVHDLMSDDLVETPRAKRVKRSHKNSSISAISPQKRSRGEGESTDINALQASDAGAALTMHGPTSTEAGGVSEGQNIVEAAPVELENARANAMESRSPFPPPALMDSPSKANQMLAVLTDDEDEKTRETTTESVRAREEAGRAAVSQLVSLRTSTKGKKSKQKTYSRGSRRKSAKSGVQVAGRTSTARALTPVSGDDEPHDSEQQAASDQRSAAIPSLNLETTPVSAEEGEGQPLTQSRATHSSTSLDLVGAGADGIASTTEPEVVVPERVFVLFKGTPPNIYPATWLGASPDHTTYKVKFDDSTVTNIEYYHVRRLELRLGDIVKVDDDKKRKKNWVVVGFGPVATTDEERALGTDIYGRTHVKVQLKGDRESLSKSTSSEAADVTHTVLVNLLYLTITMWPPFKDRAFEPPSDAITTRPSTPASARTSTPSAAGSPSSRPRRAYAPSAKAKSARPSNLRETSLASSSAASSTSAIFDGMAFAISYVSPDEEKKQVTDLIQQHGGTVLEEGFEELFDLPDMNGKNAATPSKNSPRRRDHAGTDPGLQLKSKYKDLKFAALIADRHSRRAKYMQALALGLPTISGRWILHSLEGTKNPAGDQNGPLPWDHYLLPAGESTYLNAVRSRSLTPYDATTAVLSDLVENRLRLLRNESLILVAPKTGSANMEKRKTFAFLTLACGAGRVKRVHDIADAKKLTLDDPDTWKWVYVDSTVAEAEKVLFGRAAAAGKKKKRGSEANNVVPEKMSATDGVVKLVNDEFVIQSLILEALVE